MSYSGYSALHGVYPNFKKSLLKVTLLHECFLRFLSRANRTEMCKVSHIYISYLLRLTHKLNFEDSEEARDAKDANVKGDDWYVNPLATNDRII